MLSRWPVCLERARAGAAGRQELSRTTGVRVNPELCPEPLWCESPVKQGEQACVGGKFPHSQEVDAVKTPVGTRGGAHGLQQGAHPQKADHTATLT